MIYESELIGKIFDASSINDAIDDVMSTEIAETVIMENIEDMKKPEYFFKMMKKANESKDAIYMLDTSADVFWIYYGTDEFLKAEILNKAEKKLSKKDFNIFYRAITKK